MKRRQILRLATFIAILAVTTPQTAGADLDGIVSDDFSQQTLASRWIPIDPVGDASVDMTGSGVRISIPGGVAHDFSTGANRTVRLLQSAPNSDLIVDAKLEPWVGLRSTQVGVLVEQDANNHVRFEVSHDGCIPRLIAGYLSAGKWTQQYNKTLTSGIPSFLRIQRAADRWSVGFSYDGLAWTTAKSFNFTLSVTGVAPYAGNGGSSPPAFEPVVDYFVNRNSTLAFEDGEPFEAVLAAPAVNLWYGAAQTFGAIGSAQPLADVIGNVTDPDGVASLKYSVNGGSNKTLKLGANGTTLHMPGDFKISEPIQNLNDGDNAVRITAVDTLGNQSVTDMIVHRDVGNVWPSTYQIDWSSTAQISDIAQVVNGLWGIEGDAVRTLVPGYDRLIVLGESAWESYEVSAEVTMDKLTCGAQPGVGLLLGWEGYGTPFGTETPWGAIGWYRQARSASLEILGDKVLAADRRRVLSEGVTYIFKMQMERTSVEPSEYTYRLKVWPQGDNEPSSWDLTATRSLGGGSIGLLAHQADVRFGDVFVRPLP